VSFVYFVVKSERTCPAERASQGLTKSSNPLFDVCLPTRSFGKKIAGDRFTTPMPPVSQQHVRHGQSRQAHQKPRKGAAD